MTDAPALSIVIPSHNRSARLLRTLDAIGRQQDVPLQTVEVVVVADGCVDDTVAAVRACDAPFALRTVELPGLGPSPARNRGAEAARAPLLLFLDDDVEPVPGWLAAHVQAHERMAGGFVLGAYPPFPEGQGEFRVHLRRWWRTHFSQLEEPGHRFTFRDLLTGNLSASRDLWHSLGGLDESLPRAHEDWELGVRIIAGNVPLSYAPDAFAWHHEYETADLQGMLRRATEEGRSDVRMGAKHPAIKEQLPIWRARRRGGWKYRLARRMFRSPDTEPLRRRAAGLAAGFGGWSSGPLFVRAFGFAQFVHYMHGAIEELRTLEQWKAFATRAPRTPRNSLLIDLAEGIEQAEQRLDHVRPEEARLVLRGSQVGLLPFEAGAEPWAGRHLRPRLTGRVAQPFLKALDENGLLQGTQMQERLQVPASARRHVGETGYHAAAAEAVQQWRKAGL